MMGQAKKNCQSRRAQDLDAFQKVPLTDLPACGWLTAGDQTPHRGVFANTLDNPRRLAL